MKQKNKQEKVFSKISSSDLPNDGACDLYMKPDVNSDELVMNDVPTVGLGDKEIKNPMRCHKG